MHVETCGPEDGTAVVLSAGLGGAGGYWRPNLEALARGLLHGRFVSMPHGGHACNVVEPETFERLVLEWLSEPTSAPSAR